MKIQMFTFLFTSKMDWSYV